MDKKEISFTEKALFDKELLNNLYIYFKVECIKGEYFNHLSKKASKEYNIPFSSLANTICGYIEDLELTVERLRNGSNKPV